MSMSTLDDLDDDLPDIFPGEIVHNDNGDISYKIINQIGAGRCCVVYKAVAVRDGSLVALKCFRQGNNYDGAIQRERYILDTYSQPGNNIVTSHAIISYRGYTFFVLELLQDNVRQIIFKNDRQGLSPWASVKFAKDLLASLSVLHQDGIVHADLKPANVLWSGQEGVFKCIDFGLSFSVEEKDLHQIQSTGYRAPEAELWNNYKENIKIKRKRKLEGTFRKLNNVEVGRREWMKVIEDVEDGNPSDVICDISVTKNDIDMTDSNKKRYSEDTQLQHSDSHSSGIFSLENSERSQGSQSSEAGAGKDPGLEVEVVIRNERSPCDSTQETPGDSQPEQDWRVGGPTQLPTQPSTQADIWSYGCLLAEVFTGRKLFQSGDKLASVLRPGQLLEMKLGDTEAVWAEKGQADHFRMFKDLIIRCIEEDPSERITAGEAINHSVFQNKLSLSDSSLSPLTTATLRFTRLQPEQRESETEILKLIREECQTYGEITDCKEPFNPLTIAGGHTLVYFQEVGGAVFARQCLVSKVIRDSDSETETDITNSTHTDTPNIAEIDNRKFYVTFYLYTS